MNDSYADNWEHLEDIVSWLDLMVQWLLEQNAAAMNDVEDPMSPFKGLVVSEQEVQRLLTADKPVVESDWSAALRAEAEALEARMEQRVAASLEQGVFLTLPHVARTFGLSLLEQQALRIVLAVEIDRKYEKLYAYLQDDVTQKHPSLDLVLRLLGLAYGWRVPAHSLFRADGPLRSWFLRIEDDGTRPRLGRTVRLDERMALFLLEGTVFDDQIARLSELSDPEHPLPPLLFQQRVQEQLQAFVQDTGWRSLFVLQGRSGSGKKLQLRHLAQQFGRRLVVFDLKRALQQEAEWPHLLRRAIREARLHQSYLVIDQAGELASGEGAEQRMTTFLDEAERWNGPLFLLVEEPLQSDELRRRRRDLIELPLDVPADTVRHEIWARLALDYPFVEQPDWRAMAGKFRFTAGQIERALRIALHEAEWRQGPGAAISSEVLHAACYRQMRHKLDQKAARLTPRHGFDALVLPSEQKEQLRNACNQIRFRPVVYGEWGFEKRLSYGRGLSLLFAGPPGTGKTMAAEVIAKELFLEIYKIDLSQIISKYIGETEKNMQEIFTEAQQSSAILFFDEADALFGKRSEVKDSHDKYANVETAYLLQKMEEYDGITILATNFQQNIDEAFMRRINYVVKFPFPDAAHRERIWRGLFPPETPLDPELDFAFLAQKFEFAGGAIKNIALSAAFLAVDEGRAVGMTHILRAVKHELAKTGKLLLRHELEEYADALTGGT